MSGTDYEERPASEPARATLIVERKGRYLMTLERKGLWLLPGGRIEAGETPMMAALRELGEETGLEAGSIRHLFRFQRKRNLHEVFLATIGDTDEARPCGEVQDTGWFDRAALHRMPVSASARRILDDYIRHHRRPATLAGRLWRLITG